MRSGSHGPSQGIEPLTVPLLRLTDNHATGELQLPEAGTWDVRLTLRVSDIRRRHGESRKATRCTTTCVKSPV